MTWFWGLSIRVHASLEIILVLSYTPTPKLNSPFFQYPESCIYDRQVIYPWVTSPVLPVSKFSLFISYYKETMCFLLFFLNLSPMCVLHMINSSLIEAGSHHRLFYLPMLLYVLFSFSALTHWNPFPKSDSNGKPFLYLPRGHFGAMRIPSRTHVYHFSCYQNIA